MEARSASVSIPDVDNCRSDFIFSVEDVLIELKNVGPEPLDGGDCSGGRPWGAALCNCGSDGSVAFERGDRPTLEVRADDLFLRGFLAVAALVDGRGADGISQTGESCGERSELISISALSQQYSHQTPKIR